MKLSAVSIYLVGSQFCCGLKHHIKKYIFSFFTVTFNYLFIYNCFILFYFFPEWAFKDQMFRWNKKKFLITRGKLLVFEQGDAMFHTCKCLEVQMKNRVTTKY